MGYQKSPSLSNNTYKKNGGAGGPRSFVGSQSLSNNSFRKNAVIVTISKDDIVVLGEAGDKKAIEERCEHIGGSTEAKVNDAYEEARELCPMCNTSKRVSSQAALKVAQQTKDGRDVEVSNLRVELENVKDETLGSMEQQKESEFEAKSLRTMTQRMVLTHEDMVSVVDCIEKDYTVITLQCKYRPKLLFDIACTITDMRYVVYHGVVNTGSKAEHDRVILCLEVAIERRTSELELCTEDQVGLLSNITRIFGENSLCIKRVEISTENGIAKDIFYVTDMTGDIPVNLRTIDSIHRQIGQHTSLDVKWNSSPPKPTTPDETRMIFLFGHIFKSCSFCY
ncbi:ACT domain-containing protein ACR6-like protein [Tanacetum coccineum]